MTQFRALAPGVQVSGAAILSVLRGMGAFEATGRRLVAEHGIFNPRPGTWHLQQAWLDVFRQVADAFGAATLTQIGRMIPETADWRQSSTPWTLRSLRSTWPTT